MLLKVEAKTNCLNEVPYLKKSPYIYEHTCAVDAVLSAEEESPRAAARVWRPVLRGRQDALHVVGDGGGHGRRHYSQPDQLTTEGGEAHTPSVREGLFG